ncbi:hypothetical protein HZY91_02670 [Facklamia sp. DSM 111018]|uniref:Uncharacterized protein n=1 Tax=Facklamia lactis TaxID=2749967 RepID=A0ABS0LP23_9LACT|nr:hypothetical protein [Facklamia lactis]MBG9979537.1 hypothetical protein [Facklamia lactis]MBG9985794.1 hypothetical protein [Facklamia lactis]
MHCHKKEKLIVGSGVFLTRLLDELSITIFPKSKDWFAKIRGLVQTVDGVHFSSITAKLLAKEIEGKMIKNWS